jgi:hypothetical protein
MGLIPIATDVTGLNLGPGPRDWQGHSKVPRGVLAGQNVAATVAAYGDERASERDNWPPQEQSVIIERSIATDDPHALKFAEACIGEHRLNPQPVYLAAAADWASRLHRARHWSRAERDAVALEFRWAAARGAEAYGDATALVDAP